MKNVSLKRAFEVSLAKSEFKNQTAFCEDTNISASVLQPMKKDSPCCQWRTLNAVSNALGLSIVEFLRNGENDGN